VLDGALSARRRKRSSALELTKLSNLSLTSR